MNVNFNTFTTQSPWNYGQQQRQAETTGTVANNTPVFGTQQAETTGTIASADQDPLVLRRNAETTGAIAMFGTMGTQAAQGQFMAVA